MNTKFFKTVCYEGFYDLYVCHEDTPIPTMKEVVERRKMSPYCLNDKLEEISREEFLKLHAELLEELSDSADDMWAFSPNAGNVTLWEWWHSPEEWQFVGD